MVRATLAGIGVAVAAAPLGCFVVWRRMAYFGESTAHFAMLGIALSLTFEFSVFAGAILLSLIMASLVTLTQGRSLYSDTPFRGYGTYVTRGGSCYRIFHFGYSN